MERAADSFPIAALLNNLAIRELPVGHPDGHLLTGGRGLAVGLKLASEPAKEAEHGGYLRFLSRLDGSRVIEAEDHGNRAERLAEPGARPVGCGRVVDDRPVHLQVLGGEPGHRVGELHRRDPVPA